MNKNIRRSIVIAAGVTGAWALGSASASADELPLLSVSAPDAGADIGIGVDATDSSDAADTAVKADTGGVTDMLGTVVESVTGAVTDTVGTANGTASDTAADAGATARATTPDVTTPRVSGLKGAAAFEGAKAARAA
ncbi:hypothetical protein GTW38_25550, partial [Streptomyces sp. SID7804]|nr:hypothetical protein [Streptomyces sp. SID7804]